MEMEISCGTSTRNRSDDLKKDGSEETHSRNFELESADDIPRSNSHFRSMNALEIPRESVKILHYNSSEVMLGAFWEKVKYIEGILGIEILFYRIENKNRRKTLKMTCTIDCLFQRS